MLNFNVCVSHAKEPMIIHETSLKLMSMCFWYWTVKEFVNNKTYLISYTPQIVDHQIWEVK